MDQEKIGNFIKNIRLEHNLTQKEFADMLGVTFQAVSKWENGKNIPDIEIMKEISEKFHVNIEEIIHGERRTKENKNTSTFIKWVPVFFVLVGIILVSILNSKRESFEFKTLSSKCSDFKITGSAAYNKEKASIFISNIEFCGEKDEEEYKTIECKFYEQDGKTKTEISSCEKGNNITLEKYLKDVNISVNDDSNICKNMNSSSFIVEINAKTKDNKNITYNIPLELKDNCK